MVNIVSSRKIHKEVFWQIIYEWEDDFSKTLNIPLKEVTRFKKNIFGKAFYHKYFYPYLYKLPVSDYNIFFSVVAPYEFNFYSSPDFIPVIVDAWKPDLHRIEMFCKYNKYVFLGSLEAVNELRSRGLKNVYFSPVSISKRYSCRDYPEKEIDLLVYGRNHVVMTEWIKRLYNHSNLHIVTCYPDSSGVFAAQSNKKGMLGRVNERYELMNLLKKSRYSAVSSTGNDKSNMLNHTYTGGYSPVTPRFLECTVNYCAGVGIWYSNPDFDYFGIDKIAKKVDSFDAFESAIRTPLNFDLQKKLFDNFLDMHWTDKRGEDILRIINNEA